MVNSFDVTGNVTADAVLRDTPKGKVAVFTVAENLGYFDKATNEFKKTGTNFWDVSVWTRPEEVGQLRKGQRVAVQGRLKVEEWEKDGQKHSKAVVIADRVTLALPRVDGARDMSDGGTGLGAGFGAGEQPF